MNQNVTLVIGGARSGKSHFAESLPPQVSLMAALAACPARSDRHRYTNQSTRNNGR